MKPGIEEIKELSNSRVRQLVMALEFLPQSHIGWRLPECDKTPLELYLECGGAFLMTAKLLHGETTGDEEAKPGIPKDMADNPDLATAKALMSSFQQEFFSALEKLDESKLEKLIEMPGGEQISLRDLALRPIKETCFYCSQLAYYRFLLNTGAGSPSSQVL